MKKFIATYVQTSNTSDDRPRVLGIYDAIDDARTAVAFDMQEWYENTHYGEDVEYGIDFDKMTAKVGDTKCIWNIEEIDV